MSYCINPWCGARENSEEAEVCASCGTPLLINERFKILRPIVDLARDHPFEVFEAFDSKGSYLCPPHKVKILKVLKSPDPFLIKMFERERDALQNLKHGALPFVDLEDYFSVRPQNFPFDLHCLALSKFEGVTLEQWVEEHGPLSQKLAIQLLLEISDVLICIHTEGYFHRDIKPSNIMVLPDNTIGLIDFGGVRRVTDTYMVNMSLGRYMTQLHTPDFSPPEQLEGRAVPQSDFFALGRTFIYALTAKELYKLKSDKAGRPIWREFASQIDKPLLDFIDRLCERDVDKRPQSALAILNYLDQTLPRQLKLFQLLRSKLFKLICIGLSILLIVLSYNVYRMKLAEDQVQRMREQITLSESALARGTQLFTNHQQGAARKALEESIQLHPNYDAYLRLGLLCGQTNDSRCATDSYDAALKLEPNNWEAYFGYAGYYEDSTLPDKYEKAQKYYEAALARNKTEPSLVLNNLARLLILKGKTDKALQLVEQGLIKTNEPYYRAILFKNQGWIYFLKGAHVRAKASLLTSITLEKNLASSHCLLAKTLDAQHEPSDDQWTECFSTYSEDFSNPEVKEWKSSFLKSLHRH